MLDLEIISFQLFFLLKNYSKVVYIKGSVIVSIGESLCGKDEPLNIRV